MAATGCIIHRGELSGPGYARLEPNNYCPGDTLTASVDFLGADVCPPDASCTSFFTVVSLSSTPAAFPPQSITNYTGSVIFTAPDADRVSVLFNPDRDSVLIPTAEVRPEGRVFNRTSKSSSSATPAQSLSKPRSPALPANSRDGSARANACDWTSRAFPQDWGPRASSEYVR